MTRILAALMAAVVLVACDQAQLACRPTGEWGVQQVNRGSLKFPNRVIIDVQRYTCTDGVDRWYPTK